MLKIALVGNPNSGKTTLFNGLTGSNQFVGNWPGVTVEKKSGKLKYQDFEAEIIDLPGIYSLSTISLEEEIAVRFVIENKMDLIINIVDASSLERNLYLTYQLLDSKIPMIVALNCMDIVQKKLQQIDIKKLEDELQIPVIPITASKKTGINDLIKLIAAYDYAGQKHEHRYEDQIEKTIEVFENLIGDRFLAIRFFEDGLKILEPLKLPPEANAKMIEAYERESKHYQIDFDMVIPNSRYDAIIAVCEIVLTKNGTDVISVTEKIDKILTHKWIGLPLFGLIMFMVFFLAFGPIGTWITDWFVFGIEWLFSRVDTLIANLGMMPWVSSLITNGVFGGLAAVIGFLPQLAILFLFMAILEDSGYMSRAAFIMDRLLRKFGLSGKAFIPMLIGFGCSVPAMAATRTLDKDEDRKITTMIIPFISCGAKAPIYGVFAGALFFRASYVAVFSMYVLGIIVAILSAVMFKKTILKSASANYIMELPEYRMPTVKNTMLHTWERVKGFLLKAGTILLGAFIIIWFLSYFGFVDGTFRMLMEDEIEHSILGAVGKFLLPVFRPIGFPDWQATVAMLTGLVAKESVVGTLGILYGVAGNVVENGSLLYEPIRLAFTSAQAYAFMAFALLSTPCIAAIAAMKKEFNSWKWLIFSLLYEFVVAYLVALIIFQVGSLDQGVILSIIFGIIAIMIVVFSIRKFVIKRGAICDSCVNCSIKDNCHLPKKDEFLAIIDQKKEDDQDDRE
ncbi:MAG: ferrous iron transport protein B [Candidatus Izemoplasmatales bacterium]|jgi:ferrous iron transport protein B